MLEAHDSKLEAVSPLHANHLAQRVHHIHQVLLRFHHGVARLVCHRSFVDDVRVLTAFDARGCLVVIGNREAPLGPILRSQFVISSFTNDQNQSPAIRSAAVPKRDTSTNNWQCVNVSAIYCAHQLEVTKCNLKTYEQENYSSSQTGRLQNQNHSRSTSNP